VNRIAVAAVGFTAATTGLAALLFAARRAYGVAGVVGGSMEPTLSPGDHVLFRRGTPHHPHPGDVVIITTARLAVLVPSASGIVERSPDLMIKRLVAVAGDPVPCGVPCGCATVCDGRVVVRGDADRSLDSRTWGCIPVQVLTGRATRQVLTGKTLDRRRSGPSNARPDRRGAR
jgi:signal peptidase I